MLGGRITNQDEDEVEDELAALELEVSGPPPVRMPAVPDTKLPEPEVSVVQEPEAAPQERRQAERTPMLAS